jgi:hypothetical protein
VILKETLILKEGSRVRQKTQLSCYSIYCGDSDYMFRPCLAIFRSQCWCVQMRKPWLYVGLVRCCCLSRRSPVWVRFQRWGLLWVADVYNSVWCGRHWCPHQTEFYTSAAHRSPHRWNLTHTGLLLLKRQQRTSPTYNRGFLICRHQHCDLKMAKHGRNM